MRYSIIKRDGCACVIGWPYGENQRCICSSYEKVDCVGPEGVLLRS